MKMLVCTCLYCGKVTGSTPTPERTKTVCQHCVYNADRDEARELAAGMGPWTRALIAKVLAKSDGLSNHRRTTRRD